jgi:phosphatidylinositol-3-phosphatase
MATPKNIGQKMISSKVFAFGLAVLAALSFAACSRLSRTEPAGIPRGTPRLAAPSLKNFLPASASESSSSQVMPRYDHIFVIIEENKAYEQIIGSPNAPNINRLAKTYGLATNFYGAVHPSEGNYVAMLGGSTFGIHDDDAYYCRAGRVERFCSHSRQPDYANHTIESQGLTDQLQAKNLTWKGYFEDIPMPGSKAVVSPDAVRALYAVKHNGFMNFKSVQNDRNLSQKIVGFTQLSADLQSGKLPNYSHIVPNQCNEMHGLAECPNLDKLIQTGDAIVAKLVEQITHSSLWATVQNNAIIITFDEDNNPSDKQSPQGCCGFDPKSSANFGGGHIATLVITNHGPRGIVDSTSYNHYSLLRTTEAAFGISEYLNDAAKAENGIKPMMALFAVSK